MASAESSPKMKLKKIILALLILLTALVIYLAIKESSGSTVCLVNADSTNCLSVQNSKYGSLFGVKVIYLGAIALVALTLLYIFANTKNKYRQNFKEIYLLGTVIAALSAIYFLSIQFFILQTLCSSCLVIDTALLLIVILSWIDARR